MSTLFDELERQARTLSMKEKASLARLLIEELDSDSEVGVEQIWIEEAKRRYDAFLNGKLKPLSGDDVMARARLSTC